MSLQSSSRRHRTAFSLSKLPDHPQNDRASRLEKAAQSEKKLLSAEKPCYKLHIQVAFGSNFFVQDVLKEGVYRSGVCSYFVRRTKYGTELRQGIFCPTLTPVRLHMTYSGKIVAVDMKKLARRD